MAAIAEGRMHQVSRRPCEKPSESSERRYELTMLFSYDFKAWKKSMLGKRGFFSLASGKNHGPQEAFDLYRLRDASEVQYGILKSQEGLIGTAYTSRQHL